MLDTRDGAKSYGPQGNLDGAFSWDTGNGNVSIREKAVDDSKFICKYTHTRARAHTHTLAHTHTHTYIYKIVENLTLNSRHTTQVFQADDKPHPCPSLETPLSHGENLG